MSSSNDTTPLSLWQQRLSRRQVISRGSELMFISTLPSGYLLAQQNDSQLQINFETVSPSSADKVVVPNGYHADILLSWGDPLFPGIPALDPDTVARGDLMLPAAAQHQLGQFGYNCDGMSLFELNDEEVVVCINHEYPNPELLFPGYRTAQRAGMAGDFIHQNPSCVDFMKGTVGVSVAHFQTGETWKLVLNSPFNRRVTANTPMELSGPARGHRFFKGSLGNDGKQVIGTLWNCAAGRTPWGTYLTAEENIDEYFGNRRAAKFSADVEQGHNRFLPRGGESRFRWEFADNRFDVETNPNEAFKFGWIVEIDPLDPSKPIKKRTALGRFKHEGATTSLTQDGRLVVYMGDDEAFEYFYKFITNKPFDPVEPENNVDLLDSGTLYVARFKEDGSGEWMPLVWQQTEMLTSRNGFESQADVVLRCRAAADLVGATPMDRPEDIAVNPRTGKVYLACTRNSDRVEGEMEVESAGRRTQAGSIGSNPRGPNPWGHIIELSEHHDDGGSLLFNWEIFLLAGDPAKGQFLTSLDSSVKALDPDSTYFAGHENSSELSSFGSPDNLTFDAEGNLWITTDGDQPRGNNDGCFVCPTEGVSKGGVRQFMSGPVGCEITGCEITPNGGGILLGIQHPGQGGTVEESISSWPEGGDAAPRPSVVLVEPEDRQRKLTG